MKCKNYYWNIVPRFTMNFINKFDPIKSTDFTRYVERFVKRSTDKCNPSTVKLCTDRRAESV